MTNTDRHHEERQRHGDLTDELVKRIALGTLHAFSKVFFVKLSCRDNGCIAELLNV